MGINYLDRNAENKDGSEQPKYPSVFARFPASFVAHGAPLVRPPETRQFDYEGEMALVIGKRGRRIQREQAMAHLFGYTIANEGTVREWTRHGKYNVTQGKNFDSSGSLGPWIVTADAMPPGPLRIKTRVNGQERQNDTTDRLLFPFDFLISYLSTFATLEPGDMILTGTPNGAGVMRFDPPKWLVPGDVVAVEVEGIGVLSNPVADEESATPPEQRRAGHRVERRKPAGAEAWGRLFAMERAQVPASGPVRCLIISCPYSRQGW